MYWSPDLKEKLAGMLADTPPQYHQYIQPNIQHASEQQAKKAGKSEVDEESMVRGFIVSIPRHLRDGIIEVLSQHNFDLLYYRPVFDEAYQAPATPTSTV